MRIDDYVKVDAPSTKSSILVSTKNGTRQVPLNNLYLFHKESEAQHSENPVEVRRSFFRGNNLGKALTDEQRSQIQNGLFENLWIGDYWESDGIKWRIADFDYHDDAHNIIVVPDEPLSITSYLAPGEIYDEDNPTGTYKDSYILTHSIPNILKIARNVFKYNIAKTKIFGVVELDCSYAGVPWPVNGFIESKGHLMSETMIFGFTMGENEYCQYEAKEYGVEPETQLALFKNYPDFIQPFKNNTRKGYWTRSFGVSQDIPMYSALTELGINSLQIDAVNGIRPYFVIHAESDLEGHEPHYASNKSKVYASGTGFNELL